MFHRSTCALAGALMMIAAGCAESRDSVEPAGNAESVAVPERAAVKQPVAATPARSAPATGGAALTLERVTQVIPSRILIDVVVTNTSETPQRLPRRFHVPADVQVYLVRHVVGGPDVVVLDGAPAAPEAIEAPRPFIPADFDVVQPGGSVRRALFVNGMVVGGLTPGSYVLTVSWRCVAGDVPSGLGEPAAVTGRLTAAPLTFEVRPPRVPPPGS